MRSPRSARPSKSCARWGKLARKSRSHIQLALAEKRLELQHLAANLREKYDVATGIARLPGESAVTRAELLGSTIDDLRGRLERMGEVNLAAIGEYEELTERFGS